MRVLKKVFKIGGIVKPYERLEGQGDRLMAAGLVGPVRLVALEGTD